MKKIQFEPKEKNRLKKTLIFAVIFGLVLSSINFFINDNILTSILIVIITIISIFVIEHFRGTLRISSRIRKVEEVFPDFLQLMSSNLRAGMTIDRSILVSSRREFYPLDEEILRTGRDIATGKSVETALIGLSKRIGSEKIEKTILLIISGIRSGGNLAILLDETAVNMRERNFVEKRAASNVLMYVIFISLAVSIFAPALFSLSNVLVEVLTSILSNIPEAPSNANLPFTLSKINISIDFIFYFSLVFMIVIDLFASLVIGLVNKGEEKQGLKYFPIIVVISLFVFFVSKILISNFLGELL